VPDYRSQLPTGYYFGGGDEATSATSLAVLVLLVACVLILVLPRKYAFVPFLIAAILLPLHVVVLIGSLHFNATRILILVGWVRLLFRRDGFPGRLQTLDKVVLASALCSAVAYSILWQDFGAVINRLGVLVTTMGSYFLLRCLVRDQYDVMRVIKTLAAVVLVIAPLMLYEHASAYNPFWLMGAPEITDIRDGVRAQGPFGHSIIAGTVGACLVPLFIGFFNSSRRMRLLAVAAVIGSLAMVFASRSSTPVMALGAGFVAMAMWPARKRMRAVRWGMVTILLVVQLAMKAPIWFVMMRASRVLGGSGWHRSMLVDNFVRHFFDWWLVGTRSNPDWGWSMWDVDNAYVGAGLSGGLLSFVFFISIFVCAYKVIGRARKQAEKSPRDLRLIWALGAGLFANTVAYFGIVYFDQSVVVWYTLLTMIAVVPTFAIAKHSPRIQLEPQCTNDLDWISAPSSIPVWHDHPLGRHSK
jgi:hypothetical protein